MAEPSSPDAGRLDRLLGLVTAHDSHSREQDIKISELSQRLLQLESKAAQVKDRNIVKELDMARMAVETLAKQNISLANELQQLQAQHKGAAAKQEQWQMAADALMASLQLDVGHLRQQMAELQATCRSDLEHLDKAIQSSKQELKAYMDDSLEGALREVKLDMAAFKSQYAGMTTAATKTIESWARSELNGISARMSEGITNCSKQQELLAAQLELLRSQVVVTGQEQVSSQQEARRMKKHLVKLQQQAQGLALLQPTLAQAQQDQRRFQEALQQMADQLDTQAREQQERLQQAEDTLTFQSQDMARLAQNVGACIKSAVSTTARLAGLPAPASSSSYSYLASLLAPIPSAAAPAARPASAFDVCMADYDSFTDVLKGRTVENSRMHGSSMRASPPPVQVQVPHRQPGSRSLSTSPSIRSSLDRNLLRGFTGLRD